MTLHDTRHAGSLSGLERHQHICVFYGDRDEEYRVLGSFIADGFPHGDRAFHIIDGESRADHLRRLERLGVDVAAAERRGQLELRHWEDAHLRPGWFDQDAMLALVDDALGDSRRRGFGYTRWVANMGWALGSWRGVDDLVQYCARLNEVVPSHEATIVCTYDISKFSATKIIDVLRSHPVAIVGGVVHENPYFVEPSQLLRELEDRRGRSSSGVTAT